MKSYGWALSKMVSLWEEIRTQPYAHTQERPCRHKGEPCWHPPRGLQPPGPWENTFLWVKPSSLWDCALAALANEYMRIPHSRKGLVAAETQCPLSAQETTACTCQRQECPLGPSPAGSLQNATGPSRFSRCYLQRVLSGRLMPGFSAKTHRGKYSRNCLFKQWKDTA